MFRQVNEQTSRRVNELLVREDKVTDEQVNRCLVDKPLYNKYLVCRSTRLLVNLKKHVPMLLCLLFTLSTGNSFTRPLVHSSTLKTLFLCYFVFYLPCLQATCLLVHSSTFSLFCHFIFLPFNFLFIFALSFEK